MSSVYLQTKRIFEPCQTTVRTDITITSQVNQRNYCNVVNVPANIYLFKVSNRNTRKRREICSKLRMKTSERCHSRHSLLILNIFHIFFQCFYCSLCTGGCQLGECFFDLAMLPVFFFFFFRVKVFCFQAIDKINAQYFQALYREMPKMDITRSVDT